MRWPDRLAGVIGALLLLAVLVPMGLMLWSLLEQGAGVISVDFLNFSALPINRGSFFSLVINYNPHYSLIISHLYVPVNINNNFFI